MLRLTALRSLHSLRTERWIHSAAALRKDFKLTDIGEGIVQVEVMKWFVKPGDKVKQFDKLVEVQSDKATVEITSRFDGVVKSLAMKEGDMAKVGQVLVVFEDDGSSPSPAAAKPNPSTEHVSQTKAAETLSVKPAFQEEKKTSLIHEEDRDESNLSFDKVLATPAVRRLARENNIDLKRVKGSGKEGRVMKEDILTFISDGGRAVDAPPAPQAKELSQPVLSKTDTKPKGSVTVVRLAGIRREMVKTMTSSLRIPHLGYMEDIRVDEAARIVTGRKDLTMLSVLIKAASLALVDYPELNAHADPDATELKIHSDHNIGIAMDTPRGLMVPVVHDVGSMSVFDIAKEITRLKELGANGKLGMTELSGATFSLSNIGSVGGTYACPIIAPPQVAIGAFGRAKRVPVFESPTSMLVKEAKIMPVSWSADHRVIDGAMIAKFCNKFKFYVESPTEMLLKMH